MTAILSLPYKLIHPLYQRTAFHRSVIDEVGDDALQRAYTVCREITRKYAKTFYMATRFLPNDKQRGIFAVYALCRYMDNLIDDTEDLIQQKKFSFSEAAEMAESCKHKLIDTYNGKQFDTPIMLALSDVLKSHNIRLDLPLELLEGVCMDLTKNRYANFDELYVYCYKVASVVGLMTSEIFGYKDQVALEYAVDLGIAMQLTNILRDIGEDLKMGRIYLPQDEMKDFGITEKQLEAGIVNDNFRAFMDFQIDRARSYYSRSDKGIPLLSRDSRLPVAMARYNYSKILERIVENDYQVFEKRAHLTSREKLAALPQLWWSVKD